MSITVEITCPFLQESKRRAPAVIIGEVSTWRRFKTGSAIDDHAQHNTTSVCTAAQVFPVLSEKLSTGLTSLNLGEERWPIVIEMIIAADGSVANSRAIGVCGR
jgi:exoribonuclease-2